MCVDSSKLPFLSNVIDFLPCCQLIYHNMTEDRKAWKSTEDNPYYSVYGAEKVPFLQRPEKNVILLDDCAERRDKWQHCLKKIEGPENEKSSNLHLCNELWGRYKFCIEMYKAVSFVFGAM